MEIYNKLLDRPKASLVLIFAAWKTFLFAAALASPGVGYDTSTTLLHLNTSDLSTSFVRWDGIYYTQIAQRGYLFEQDWAFGWGFTRIIAIVGSWMRHLELTKGLYTEAWTGILIAHLAHLSSVIFLYYLSLKLFQFQPRPSTFAYIVAVLHIISPAGLFLSAPCPESLFSALQFGGLYLYVSSSYLHREGSFFQRDLLLLLSGIAFGIGSTVRSNGILSGIPFAYDALVIGTNFIRQGCPFADLRRLAIVVLAGSFIATGAAIPQFIAFQEYCTHGSGPYMIRPWCKSYVPSIYTFVQSYYWNNGFLRYWTVSNIPLFLLAAPTLAAMAKSCEWAMSDDGLAAAKSAFNKKPRKPKTYKAPQEEIQESKKLLALIALPQTTLATFTLTNAHVQIITRLASGYPVWYWWLATMIMDEGEPSPQSEKRIFTKSICIWMVMYALVQGGLYASFLPPA